MPEVELPRREAVQKVTNLIIKLGQDLSTIYKVDERSSEQNPSSSGAAAKNDAFPIIK